MTTEMIDAETAKSLGLANHVVPQGEEVNKAKELINTIAGKSPLAVREVIRCVNAYFDPESCKCMYAQLIHREDMDVLDKNDKH